MNFEEQALIELVAKVGLEKAAEMMGKPEQIVRAGWVSLAGKYDAKFFAGNLLKIRTDSGTLASLVYNRGQQRIQDAIDRQMKAGKPVRIKLLKARQFGGSTKIQGDFFRSLIYNEHKQYLTVCHDLDSARNMRAMFQRFHSNFKLARPSFTQASDKWWKFKEKDSDYLIDTADELDTGRSFTIHSLHASEVAYYRDAETLMTGLLQAVPREAGTTVIIESTANGIGDYFYNFIHANNGYELVFVAWYDIEKYQIKFDTDAEKLRFENNLTNYEKELVRVGVTLEQLNWRTHRIEEELHGDEEKFKQEFPSTVEEAFISSGRPYFKMGVVHTQLVKTKNEKPDIGYLEWVKDGDEKKVQFIADPDGFWKVFERPSEGWEGRYVTGNDSAEGKIISESNKSPDNSVSTVFDRKENKDAARFCARIDTDLFANEIHKASVWYGSVCDAVERNSSGLAVIDALKDKEITLYRKTNFGQIEDKETAEYGFQTNVASRDELLTELRTWIRTGLYQSKDYDLWKECSTFVYDSKGKPQGQKGSHDDRVFSAALAIQAALQANEVSKVEKKVDEKKLAPDTEIWGKEEVTPEMEMAQF